MNAVSNLKRTYKTNLTDEELLILDVLFDENDTFEALVKENYGSWHNLPYSHHLETGALQDLIDKLLGNEIIISHSSGPDNRIFYGLTEAGGKLWELERVPDWERYCIDSSAPDENEHWVLQVESSSITTARAFLDCASDCRLYRFHQDDIRIITLKNEKISTIDWRMFPTVCSISVPTDPLPNGNVTDWNEYESRRTWWRDLRELAKFQLL